MKKDIKIKRVEDIAIAVVPADGVDETDWNVFFLNLKDEPVDGVLIRSRGYGRIKGQERKTSTLRHLLGTVDPESYAKVETIKRDVFGMTNEFWVSFRHKGYLYDKKYIFVAESISPNLFTEIPLVGKRGVMIR